MRIAQVVLADASEFERKSQRLDLAALSGRHEVVSCDIDAAADCDAAVVHIYGTSLPHRALKRIAAPYVAPADLTDRRFTLRRAKPPQFVLSPVRPQDEEGRLKHLPEAVDDGYFSAARPAHGGATVGTFGRTRPGVANAVEQALSRIQRFRDDVTWRFFDHPPSPADLAGVDAWADPATTETDFDGFTAEAMVAGTPVVATRTAINAQRLEHGRSGFLVPPHDPNELVHAILAALFKPEVARLKIEAAKQTAGRFRSRQRLRVLDGLYEALILR